MASYTQYMGVEFPAVFTTTPWQAHLAEKIFSETGDSAVKSFFGPQGWNASLIDKMYKLSKDDLLPGADPVLYISTNAGVTLRVAKSFLNNLPEYEGKSVKEGAGAMVEKIVTAVEKTVEGVGSSASALPVILLILAAGVAGYLVLAGKHGVKLTPEEIRV